MKIVYALVIGLLIVITNNCFAYSCSSCETYKTSYCSDIDNRCACTDPQCESGNPCLSRRECCHVFGNIGVPSENPK